MSASKPRALWRGVQAVLRAIGLGRAADLRGSSDLSGVQSGVAVLRLPSFDCATVTIAPVPAWLAEFVTVDDAPSAVAAELSSAPPLQRSAKRPLAGQLAATAAQNVAKGRKPRHAVKVNIRQKPIAALPRRAPVLKAKPVLRVAKQKRAQKRRHVWLSTQIRVVRPVQTNVVPLDYAQRGPRAAGRSTTPKFAGRTQRLAA